MAITERFTSKFLDGRSKQQYFTVAEQILFSASSMLASIVVVATAGVSWFGIYSFMFVLASFGNAFISTLLLRQMTLEISTLDTTQRRAVFLATLAMMSVIFLTVLLSTLFALTTLSEDNVLIRYRDELIACELFVFFYSYFDAARQYLYVTNRHKHSFRYTLIYAVTLACILLLVASYSAPEKVVHRIFLGFSFSTIVCLIFNQYFYNSILDARWESWGYVKSVFEGYFRQSRFRLVGLGVNWTQNQSFNPFLMLVAGPLVAGYFSLARLLVMPISVVNQGLINSSIPNLRRAFKNSGFAALEVHIDKLQNKNLIFSSLYILLLTGAHFSGLLNALIPEYEQVKWFLLIWVVSLLITIPRFWMGQFFVVSMQFKYLMQVALAALAVSLTGMLVAGFIFGQVYVALLFVIVGELVAIAFFKRKRAQTLAKERIEDA